MNNITQIKDYKKEKFSHKLKNNKVATHDVYSIGEGSKVVVIIQELPGIGQETLALADRFVGRGYRVVLPHLFGPIGKTATASNFLRVVCMRREFKIFSKNMTSPIVDFLSKLCTSLKTKHQVKGVAVIGMCLTGNFAISLMANSDVLAGFASQPSLPIFRQNSLHMSPEEMRKVKHNLDTVGAMHCGHFEKDRLCTKKKMNMLDENFNYDDKQRIIFHELPGKGHAILTMDFVDKKGHPTYDTLMEIFDYFDFQLN